MKQPTTTVAGRFCRGTIVIVTTLLGLLATLSVAIAIELCTLSANPEPTSIGLAVSDWAAASDSGSEAANASTAKRAAVAISTEGALKYSASLHSLQIDSAACTARDNHGEVLLLAHLDKPISTASGRLDLASSLKLPPNDRGYGWFELGRIDTIHCDLHGRATLLGVLSVPVANATLTFRTAHNPHEDHSLVISASLPAAPSHPVSRHIRIPSGSAFPLANLTAAAARSGC